MIFASSYNVMCHKAEKNVFASSYTNLETRLPKIRSRILDMISHNAIIALQEVDDKIFEGLEAIFESNNYLCSRVKYGNHGSLIAYNSNYYNQITEGYTIIGNKVKLLAENFDPSLSPCIRKGKKKVGRSAFKLASGKQNKLAWLKLRDLRSGRDFFIFNFHLPVSFFCLPVAGALISIVVNEIITITQGTPYILATDLNANPKSCAYKYITGSNISGDCEQDSCKHVRKRLKPHPEWPFPCSHLRDTRACLGIEGHTARSKDPSGKIFSECIDYIFVSPRWEIVDFYQKGSKYIDEKKSLYDLEELPSRYEGSDHIPIMVELNF